MTLRMHAERTTDPEVVEFVVRDLPCFDDVIAQGRFTGSDLDGLPLPVSALVAAGDLDEVVVMGERVACRRARAAEPWPQLAPRCADALTRSLRSVDHTARLRAAVAQGVGVLARSHGGAIVVVDADAERVCVRLEGACDGCPASAQTLLHGLRADMTRAGIGAARVEVV